MVLISVKINHLNEGIFLFKRENKKIEHITIFFLNIANNNILHAIMFCSNKQVVKYVTIEIKCFYCNDTIPNLTTFFLVFKRLTFLFGSYDISLDLVTEVKIIQLYFCQQH